MTELITDEVCPIDKEIILLIGKLTSYQLEILSYCTKNDLPNFSFEYIEKFNLYESEIILKKLKNLNSKLDEYLIILTKNPLLKIYSSKYISYANLISPIISQLIKLIDFYQKQNSILIELKHNLSMFKLNLIYEKLSFPHKFNSDNQTILKKLVNMPFESNKYLVSISQYSKSSNFLTPYKNKSYHVVYQKNDNLGFKNDANVYYSNSKDIFLNKLFSTISNLSDSNYNLLNSKPKIITIIIYSSHNTTTSKGPPKVSNEDLFLKLA
jgi:hypothetical protein